MRNINKVILIGNVARAPEARSTNGGQKMATFVLATNRTWYDPNGKKQGQAEFHNMLAWGKIAEICERFLQKSTLVYLEGYLKTRSWENDAGARFYRTEVVVQDILVLDRGIRNDNSGGQIQEQVDVDESDEGYQFEETYEDEQIEHQQSQEEKPASEIEKNFQDRLNTPDTAASDTTLGASPIEQSVNNVDIDSPLFEEEIR
jgi:single-strand DNA-binding protein